VFDELTFKSFLWKGQLRDAVDYLRGFKEKEEVLSKYINIFNEGQYLIRTNNEVIYGIDKIYQEYYKDIFWRGVEKDDAEKELFRSLKEYSMDSSHSMIDDDIENEIAKIVTKEGYQYLGGDTSGWYGPYIWKDSTRVTYEVELPNSIEQFTIIMMDGFISRSWLDYISFGITGTGGWIGKDGTLYCVKSVYDIESKEFNISFLKHEAQHGYDIKNFPGISNVDLEYRAKLVELIYWPDDKKMLEVLGEADNTNPDNGHSIAAHRIVTEMSIEIFNCEYMDKEQAWIDRISDIKRCALELFRHYSV
jgi:hypothetical protein